MREVFHTGHDKYTLQLNMVVNLLVSVNHILYKNCIVVYNRKCWIVIMHTLLQNIAVVIIDHRFGTPV